jgi:hypothetical protein
LHRVKWLALAILTAHTECPDGSRTMASAAPQPRVDELEENTKGRARVVGGPLDVKLAQPTTLRYIVLGGWRHPLLNRLDTM